MTWEAIEVLLRNGKCVKVALDGRVGAFGIHLRLWDGAPRGPGWTITHIDSKSSIWHTQTLDEAIRVARHLDDKNVVPPTAEGVQQWLASMTPFEKTAFNLELHRMAPPPRHPVDLPMDSRFARIQ